MNVDGNQLKQLTTDGAPKNDLQWLNRNTLLFLTGTIVRYYKLDTDSVETLTSFPASLFAGRLSGIARWQTGDHRHEQRGVRGAI